MPEWKDIATTCKAGLTLRAAEKCPHCGATADEFCQVEMGFIDPPDKAPAPSQKEQG